ncbi:hypothetical protein Dsin_032088 [Dipteronia sinensis]|uniref:Acyl-activating enzyme 5, peroxisomal n=1 Tax=Dipteronia sinensis TaxID=43782 RepID=A0AAE0DT02_9ROSI|nr:hypothetical protein Dsin_032088 [Dipteronia sinensis]
MEQVKPNPANSSPQTPLSLLEKAATVFDDCPSIIYNDTTYTWSQTHRRCLQLACSLSSLGITRGDVVSIIAPNIPAMYEVHFAVPFTAAILNTINTRLDARTVSVLLQHCQSKLLFVDYFSRSLVLEAISLFPPDAEVRPLLVLITDDDQDDDAVDSDFGCTYESLVKNGDPGFKWVRPKSEWDPIVLNYTSGTTSAPKGVVHCHRGIYSIVVDTLIDWSVPKQPVYLWTLPMFHANGWCLPWGIAAAGGTNICLRLIVSCAWKPHWNLLPAAERARLKARQGVKVGASTEVDVVDPVSGVSVRRDGSSLGEIVLRGGSVMLGYLKDPIGTRKCLSQEGWFYTGDVGVMHPDGYLEIKDRSKDVIISGGENLSSVEVESVLYTNPAINEAAVVARPDEYWGETPCAFVSFKTGLTTKPSEKEIIEYCRAKLPHYMVPKTVVFQDELPKTSTGKIQKFVLREIANSMGKSARLSRL